VPKDIRRAAQDELPAVLDLIQRQFAYMDDRIDPPSSMYRLTVEGLTQTDVWVAGDPICACMVLTPVSDHLYLGKVAIEPAYRGQGLLEELVNRAEDVARELRLNTIQLESRIELKEVHRAFAKVGFQEVRTGAHDGYAKDTFIVMEKAVE